MRQETKQERQKFLRDLMEFLINRPVPAINSRANATDEEVLQFINLFMESVFHYNRTITSYRLKHAAEKTIGYLFYGTHDYHYVSNDQFKRVINERGGFCGKPSCEGSPNDVYAFRWRPGAMDVLVALGVFEQSQRGLLHT